MCLQHSYGYVSQALRLSSSMDLPVIRVIPPHCAPHIATLFLRVETWVENFKPEEPRGKEDYP